MQFTYCQKKQNKTKQAGVLGISQSNTHTHTHTHTHTCAHTNAEGIKMQYDIQHCNKNKVTDVP